jgi:hypothetical protein
MVSKSLVPVQGVKVLRGNAANFRRPSPRLEVVQIDSTGSAVPGREDVTISAIYSGCAPSTAAGSAALRKSYSIPGPVGRGVFIAAAAFSSVGYRLGRRRHAGHRCSEHPCQDRGDGADASMREGGRASPAGAGDRDPDGVGRGVLRPRLHSDAHAGKLPLVMVTAERHGGVLQRCITVADSAHLKPDPWVVNLGQPRHQRLVIAGSVDSRRRPGCNLHSGKGRRILVFCSMSENVGKTIRSGFLCWP